MKLNAEQRKHIAGSLQTIALGQLAFFGYRSVEQFHYDWILGSLMLAAVLERCPLRAKGYRAMMNPYIAMAIIGAFCLVAVSPILISDWRDERRRRRRK